MKFNTRTIAIALLILAVCATTIQAARAFFSETGADAARSSATSDPVEDLVRRETLSQVPDLRQKPAPFQRLQIPEPREFPRLIGLREQPVETDMPAASTGTPPRPVLPVAPAK